MIRGVLALSVLVFGQGQALAQATEPTVEALGFVGTVTDGGGATFGGGMQVATGRLVFAAEVGYLTLEDNFSGGGASVDRNGLSVDLNAQYLFQMANNEKLTPYLLGGLGILRVTASVSAGGVGASASDTTAGLNLGGGVRYAVGTNWGLRPEVKFLIADGNTNARLSIGAYYAFGN